MQDCSLSSISITFQKKNTFHNVALGFVLWGTYQRRKLSTIYYEYFFVNNLNLSVMDIFGGEKENSPTKKIN